MPRYPASLVLVFVLAAALLALSGGLYHHVRSSEAEHLRVVCDAEALGASTRVRSRYAHIQDALRRLAHRGYADQRQGEGGRGVKAWTADARWALAAALALSLIVVGVVTAARGFRLRAIRSEGRYRNLFDASQDDSRKVVLSVADDGVGVLPGVDLYALPSLGLRLVALLVEQ